MTQGPNIVANSKMLTRIMLEQMSVFQQQTYLMEDLQRQRADLITNNESRRAYKEVIDRVSLALTATTNIITSVSKIRGQLQQ